MSPFEDLYDSLRTPPEEEDTPPDTDYLDFSGDPINSYYRNWGFTVYRTSYNGPSSNQLWETLLADIQTQVEAEINKRTKGNLDPQSQEVLSLFRLDLRSDQEHLAGLNMQQVRDLFLQESTELPKEARPMNWRPREVACHLFLLVDDEVMEAAAAAFEGHEPGRVPWVKCVDADETGAKHRNTRVRQIYFGWMRMSTRGFADMWEELALFRELRRIAPVMTDISGRGADIYDGVDGTVKFSG